MGLKVACLICKARHFFEIKKINMDGMQCFIDNDKVKLKARSWCFTTDKCNIPEFNTHTMVYITYAKTIYGWKGYVTFNSSLRYNSVLRWIGDEDAIVDKCDIRCYRFNVNEILEGPFACGEKSYRGKRNDLVRERIETCTVVDLCKLNNI
jgi:hypothetical protein